MKYISIILLSVLSFTICKADDDFEYSKAKYKSFMTIYVGFYNGGLDNGFFKVYKEDFNGKVTTFKTYPNVGLSFKYQYFPHWKFGISVDFLKSQLRDSYTELFEGSNFKRDYVQSIDVSSIPFLFNIDLVPRELPYRTFVGAGVGLCLNKMSWTEKIDSKIPADTRRSSNIFSENFISPAAAMYFGVELDFDKEYKYSMVGGLILEGKILYIYRHKDYLSKVEQQFSKKNNNFNENYTILPFYFGLSIGVSLNFYKFK